MLKKQLHRFNSGIVAAFLAALLFGLNVPFAKLLLSQINPWLLAALLYLGSGLGLTLFRLFKRLPLWIALTRSEIRYLVSAIGCGGILAPVLLMWGLMHMPATEASLLLNAESVFTALLAWCLFKENVDRRVFIGMLLIIIGSILLTLPASHAFSFSGMLPFLAVLGACLGWALDNNLTRQIAALEGSWLTAAKGVIAGVVNLLLAFSLPLSFPSISLTLSALLLGFVTYGISLAFFVIALRHIGTARTSAYFSLAPFIGAIIALAMGEPLSTPLLIAAILMAAGIVLHLTEQHQHPHQHQLLEHSHAHQHDEHHQHPHDEVFAEGASHTHWHQHQPLLHEHHHYPDLHHQHSH